jgi:glutaminase
MTINGSLILTHLTNTYEQSHIRFGRFLNVLNHTLRYDDTLTLDTLDYNNQSECGDNFISSAYELLGHGSFGKPKPPKQVFERSVDLFFKNRSIEIDTNKASVMSCILANKGINPFTDEQVFNDHIVSDCVKLLHLHGMNDYSGQFGFEVGLPAKTSDSGLTMLVAPGKFGLCVRSTLLDINNNSEYGIHFCRNLCNMEEYCYRNIYRF